jgi:hypothetical protein
MAIWQMHLAAIPRKGIVEKLGFIPEKLPIILAKNEVLKEKYSLKELIANKNKWAEKSWYLIDIQPIEIIHQIGKYVKRADYGDDLRICWKTYSDETDNDASLSIDAETGKINELIFRADLRENELKFLKNIIRLSQLYDWLLIDFEGQIADPNKDDIKHLIQRSNAFRFIKNPLKYLTDLNKSE